MQSCGFMGFPSGSAGKDSACNAGDLGSIPGLGRYPGGGNDYPLQYFCLENSTDRGARWATSPWAQVGHIVFKEKHLFFFD